MKGRCNKCGVEAEILPIHLGRKHKRCEYRKVKANPFSRKDAGEWERVDNKEEKNND